MTEIKEKVLIATAWWPTKTYLFEKWSKGVSDLLNLPFYFELFITTKFHESKYGSNFNAIKQSFDWAKNKCFDYILILDADIIISKDDFMSLFNAKKDIIVCGRGSDSGIKVLDFDSCIGWGCCLINRTVYINVDLEYAGDYLSPDKMFFKKCRFLGYEVWVNMDVVPKIMEQSAMVPMEAFSNDESRE